MEKVQKLTGKDIKKRLEEQRKKMNLPRISELTEEEQSVLDAIKIGLQEIKDGERGISPAEMRELIFEEYGITIP